LITTARPDPGLAPECEAPLDDTCAAMLVLLLLLALLASNDALSTKSPTKVVIAGAGSSVGFLTFKKLMRRRKFSPIALVSNDKEYKALKKLGASDEQIKICDITQKSTLKGLFSGADKVVICSTAAPKKRLGFRIKNFLRGLKFWTPKVGRKKAPAASDMYYEKGKRPYEVDFLGQKNIVDECLKAKVDHVVLLGSTGGESAICSVLIPRLNLLTLLTRSTHMTHMTRSTRIA
jgi:hypothetical protein